MSAMVLGSNDVDADGAVHDQRRYGIAYYGELEKLIEGEEAKLAKMMSDRDMLHGQSTAVAQAKQILEQEEQKQKCRLERIELLLQLRMLQHEQPWGAYQKALESKGSVPASCSGIGSQKPKLAIMLSANGTDTANSRDDTGQAGHEIENDPAPEHPVDDGNDSINSVVGASVPEARELHEDGSASLTKAVAPDFSTTQPEATGRVEVGEDTILAPTAASLHAQLEVAPATAIASNQDVAPQSGAGATPRQQTAPGVRGRAEPVVDCDGDTQGGRIAAEDGQGAAETGCLQSADAAGKGVSVEEREQTGAPEQQRAAKRARINPMGFLCKFQLHGECRDPTCTDIHTDPPLPEGLGTRARAQSAVRLVGKVSIAMVERRAGSPVNGAGGPGLQELQEVSEEGGGVPASDQGPAMRAGHSQMSDSGGKVLDRSRENGAVEKHRGFWEEFIAFSPLPMHLQEPDGTDNHVLINTPGLQLFSQHVREPGVDRNASSGADTDKERRQGAQGVEDAQEEEDLQCLEQQWRACIKERYFGVTAQLAAARELASRQPSNVQAWLRVAAILLREGGGGRGSVQDVNLCQDLALNALSNGLDANPTAIKLWLAYLEVLDSKDAREGQEMLQIALQKVPFALRLWQRLASAQTSPNAQLAVWHRAVLLAESTFGRASARTDTAGDGAGRSDGGDGCVAGASQADLEQQRTLSAEVCGVFESSENRKAFELWHQAHVAAAAVLVRSNRRPEASRLLSKGADRLVRLLGLCRYSCATQNRGSEVLSETAGDAEIWMQMLPVIERFCLLSVRVVMSPDVSSYRIPPAAVAAMVGKSPSSVFPGVGAECDIMIGEQDVDDQTGPEDAMETPLSRVWTAGAIWLRSLTLGELPMTWGGLSKDEVRSDDGGEENAVCVEAFEHVFNFWRTCTTAAERVSANGGGNGSAIVELLPPALAGHYVTVLRRLSPLRGACTARERILAMVVRSRDSTKGGRALSAHAGWLQRIRVLVALGRDAVLSSAGSDAHLLSRSPSATEGATGADANAMRVGQGSAIEGWDDDDETTDRGRVEDCELVSLMLAVSDEFDTGVFKENPGGGAFESCSRSRNLLAGAGDRLEAAGAAAELVYWRSRLAFTMSSNVNHTLASSLSLPRSPTGPLPHEQSMGESRVQLALHALHHGLGRVEECLGQGLRDRDGFAQDGKSVEVGEGEACVGSVSRRLMTVLHRLLTNPTDEVGLENANGKGNEKEAAPGCSRARCSQAGASRSDMAEELLAWWLVRSYVWARFLETLTSQTEVSLSSVKWAAVLSKGFEELRCLEDECGPSFCSRCTDHADTLCGAGCWYLRAKSEPGAGQLCRKGLLPLAYAALCSEWLHILQFVLQGTGRSGVQKNGESGASRFEGALREIMTQLRKGLTLGTEVEGCEWMGCVSRRGLRRWRAAVAAWEAVIAGDESDSAPECAAHSPGLLQHLLHEITRANTISCIPVHGEASHAASLSSGGVGDPSVPREAVAMVNSLIDLARDASSTTHPAHAMCGALSIFAAVSVLHLKEADVGGGSFQRLGGRAILERSASLVEGLKDLAPDVRESEVYWLLLLELTRALHEPSRPSSPPPDSATKDAGGGAIGVAAEAGMREGCQEQDRGKQRVMAVVQAALAALPESSTLVRIKSTLFVNR